MTADEWVQRVNETVDRFLQASGGFQKLIESVPAFDARKF